MKSPILLLLLCFFAFTACQTEELPPEIIAANEEETTGEETTEEDITIDTSTAVAACDAIPTDWSLPIDCSVDLDGKTIDLPANAVLTGSGEIINGTLNFTGGQIDGILLTSSLQLSGDVSLTSPIFEFVPERWRNIVQGNTTSEIAQKNNDNLEWLFNKTKELGATTFKMDKFDAFFEVNKVTSTTSNQNFYAFVEGVNIPSDFNLIMSDETVLRVFPTESDYSAALLVVHEVSNVTVTGGVLYGDRDLISYSKANAEEGTHLFLIRAGSNVILDGIKFTMGSFGGLNINSTGFSFNPDYNPTNNIRISNCLFEKVRMMSIALTDGNNITIENNTFIDAAQPTQNSDGGVVGYAINLEPVRTRDPNTNEIVDYQKVHDVVIRGNTERNSRIGSFTIYVGDNIIIENNDLDRSVSWSFPKNSKIRNNTFTARTSPEKPAIIAGGYGDTVFNNEISGNTITGYSTGITAYHGKLKIFDNTINNTINAIHLFEMTDAEISGNTIVSDVSNSRGITFQITNADGVLIADNDISVKTAHLNFIELNYGSGFENNTVIVERNRFNSSDGVIQFSKTNGVIFRNNESIARIQMTGSSGIEILSNTINASDGHGIALSTINSNINISQNTITRPSNFECVFINSTTNSGEVTQSGNNCN